MHTPGACSGRFGMAFSNHLVSISRPGTWYKTSFATGPVIPGPFCPLLPLFSRPWRSLGASGLPLGAFLITSGLQTGYEGMPWLCTCCWQWLAGPWRGEVVDPPASHWAPQPPRTGFVESKYFSRIVVDSPSTIEEAVGMSVDFPEGALYRVPPNPKPCQ